MKRLITLILTLMSLIPANLFGQSTIKGVVLDNKTGEPLPFATVYINGTTKGTTTDNDGRFELKDVSFPATVVFSFVGYKPQACDLDCAPNKMTIALETNDELPEVVISGKVKRRDLNYFKRMFLGDDYWGRNATIRNEEVIMIDNSESSKPVEINHKTVGTDEIKSIFKAWANEPLVIDMPLLGYELYVDLVQFAVEKTGSRSYTSGGTLDVNIRTQCDMLGYFYFKPYENLKKRQAEKIAGNRRQAYYNSSQHFLRSFYEDRLEENGYTLSMTKIVSRITEEDTIIVPMVFPVDIKKYSAFLGDNMMQIYGLNGSPLNIRYYHQRDGSPLNLKENKEAVYLEEEEKNPFGPSTKIEYKTFSKSGITFREDTCTFLKEGVVFDNNIMFGGTIAEKRVGACLPDDYTLVVNEKKNRKETVKKYELAVKDSSSYTKELMKFAGNIRQFNELFPQEKVYLEFDNTAYFQGENIWYKAFVAHATTLERAPSGVLYVDFLAPTGQLLRQQKLEIVAGQANGTISLLDEGTAQSREKRGVMAYPSGFYEIRAYTQNMLDFSPEAIFSRVIPVYTQPKYVGEYDKSHVVSYQDNPLIENVRDKTDVPKRQNNNVNVTFYPEGGDLVNGLPCKVAFKATGDDAFGIKGALVVPGLDDSVLTFHDGMGSFIIAPKGTGTVQFITPDGKSSRFSLPRPVRSGYSMIANPYSDSLLQVNIWRTLDRKGEPVALTVTCRGDIIYFEEIKDSIDSSLNIDCSSWPIGVCRMTLYDRNGMILSSRSIFHNNDEFRSPTIIANTDSMSRQEFGKEVLEFKLNDKDGNPLRDRFCLSVRDAEDYGGGQTDNLQTNLLLSSDLRGYIHDPAWYLESNDEEHREALNLLTLVQGWERYEWQYMTGLKDFEEKHRIEEGLTMNGWILSNRKREPVADIGIYAVLVPDESKKLHWTIDKFEHHTDSTGYFGFDLSDFYGEGKFSFNLMSTKRNGKTKYERNKRIKLERADRPASRALLKQEMDLNHNKSHKAGNIFNSPDDDRPLIISTDQGIVLDAVDVEAEAGKRQFIDYDTFTSFDAEEDTEMELDMGEYTTNVEGYFLDRGIRFGDAYVEETNENDTYIEKGIKPFFYVHNQKKLLDKKPFDNPMQIDMIDVKSILVYDQPMTLRQLTQLTPLLNDYHRKHIDTEWFQEVETSWDRYYLIDIQIKEDKNLLFYGEIRDMGRRYTKVQGYARPVQFYSPEYPDGPISGDIDPRRTLYWNPNVVTDNDGRARVEFYNNNFTRKFTIKAAGITASGIPYILNQNW